MGASFVFTIFVCFHYHAVMLANVKFSHNTADLVEALKAYPAVFIVADRKVSRFITEPLAELCAESGVSLRGVLNLRISERRKTLKTVQSIVRWLIGVGANRNALVLAVGGGVTTDLAGFAACIYKRGVKYANVPTTLLAQADAAIGGKTGCNIDGYKNMAGIIMQPEFTFINTDFVKTQSWDGFSEGLAEMLKTFLIADAEAYEHTIALEDYDSIEPLVRRAVEIKSSIVERDEKENGERRLLNLGHSFAHAIEYRSSHCLLWRRIQHGHAVAMGIILAAELSERQGVAQKGLAEKLKCDFRKAGLETDCPWDADELKDIIRTDKKAEDGKVRFVLIKEPGKCEIESLTI